MKNNLVISLVGVNSYHVDDCQKLYYYLKRQGYTVKVLTSKPGLFEAGDAYEYSNRIFTYLDKILYCLDLVRDYDTDVLHLDADLPAELKKQTDYKSAAKYYSRELIDSFLERSKEYQVTYIGSWPGGDFDKYKHNACFRYLKEYCEYKGIEYKDWKTIWEYVLFFRKDIDYDTVRYELETIAPIFTYMSLMNNETYCKQPFALGGAEGLALSIVLDKLGIESKEVLI